MMRRGYYLSTTIPQVSNGVWSYLIYCTAMTAEDIYFWMVSSALLNHLIQKEK